MIENLLNERKLPKLSDRKQMVEILLNQEYGQLPPIPDRISYTCENDYIKNFCAGKATCQKITIHCHFGTDVFSFPLYCTIPTTKGKHPFFVHINFRDCVTDRYQPAEEIIDNGFGLLSFCYNDVTKDNNDFCDGLAGILFKNGVRQPDDPGKIAIWAWAAHRALDYAQNITDRLDLDCAVVCGHSRLGKTALLAGATDPRFKFVYSNDSGCSGAAISRGKKGETVSAICKRFPYWFCENYYNYADNEDTMPFDQHFLLASIAPRCVLVGSAVEDAWADPVSEFLSCAAAAAAFGDEANFHTDLPECGDAILTGKIGYQIRSGSHYFSREDWNRLFEFINIHRKMNINQVK